jgi:ribosome maturation factor RimP
MNRSDLEVELRTLAASVARESGVEFVELSLRGSGSRQLLRVDIDRPGPEGVTVDDCQRVSGALGAQLDERDLIPFGYMLEVSSPGADRPIRTQDDFRRNVGRRVEVKTVGADGARRTSAGLLAAFDGETVTIETRDGSRDTVPFEAGAGVLRFGRNAERVSGAFYRGIVSGCFEVSES